MNIDDLLAKYSPAQLTFNITLPGGEVLAAKILTDASEMMELESKAGKVQDLARTKPHPAWKEFLPATDAVVRGSVIMEALMIEPKVDFIQAMRMAKTAGNLFVHIVSELVSHSSEAVHQAETKAIDVAGEGSGVTGSGEPTSPSQETSGTVTPPN